MNKNTKSNLKWAAYILFLASLATLFLAVADHFRSLN